MKRVLFCLFLIIASQQLFAQIKFEKGYVINADGQRIECLIRNSDWGNNPEQIKYKVTETDEPVTADAKSIKEFGIGTSVRYVSANVKISRQSQRLNSLTNKRMPELSEELLFLKVVIEGEASLYFYHDDDRDTFFYSVRQSPIQLLVRHLYVADGKLNEFFGYKQQLLTELKCAQFTEQTVKNLNYNADDLSRHIKRYNECVSGQFVEYEGSRDIQVSMAITSGLSYSSLSVGNGSFPNRTLEIDATLGARLGVNVEFILPFNKNKWSVIFDPAYQSYQAVEERSSPFSPIDFDYKTVQLPFGLRHYFFLDDQSSIFVNAAYVLDIDLGSTMRIRTSDLDVKSVPNIGLGVGYRFKRISAELRYHTEKNTLGNYVSWYADFKQTALIVSYKMF